MLQDSKKNNFDDAPLDDFIMPVVGCPKHYSKDSPESSRGMAYSLDLSPDTDFI